MSNDSPNDPSTREAPARRQAAPPAAADRPRRQLTKAEVQEQLRRRSASIDGHLDGVQRELQATGTQAQNTAEHVLEKYTFLALGGLALTGAAIGYLFFRRKGRDRYGVGSATGDLVDRYLDAVRRDVRTAVARGEESGHAVDRALRDHVPLVVHQGEAAESKGLVSEIIALVGRVVLSMGIGYAVDAFAESYLPDDATPGGDQVGEQVSEEAAPAAVAGP